MVVASDRLLSVALLCGAILGSCFAQDEIPELLGEGFMSGGLGLSIKTPRLERRLENASLEFWLNGLRDARSLDDLRKPEPPSSLKNMIEERLKKNNSDLRVKDIFYYYYTKKNRDPELELPSHLWQSREWDTLIDKAIARIETTLISQLTSAQVVGFETPMRTLEVLLRSVKENNSDLFFMVLSGDALAQVKKERDGENLRMALVKRWQDLSELRFYKRDNRVFADVTTRHKADKQESEWRDALRFIKTRAGWRVDLIEQHAPDQEPGEK